MPSPCAACKLLRRKCTDACIFAPVFPPDNPEKFACVHRVFGASNVSKLLKTLTPEQRQHAATSLAYQASDRLKDPIHGSIGTISVLSQKLTQVEGELSIAMNELSNLIGPEAMMLMPVPLSPPSRQQSHLFEQDPNNPSSSCASDLLAQTRLVGAGHQRKTGPEEKKEQRKHQLEQAQFFQLQKRLQQQQLFGAQAQQQQFDGDEERNEMQHQQLDAATEQNENQHEQQLNAAREQNEMYRVAFDQLQQQPQEPQLDEGGLTFSDLIETGGAVTTTGSNQEMDYGFGLMPATYLSLIPSDNFPYYQIQQQMPEYLQLQLPHADCLVQYPPEPITHELQLQPQQGRGGTEDGRFYYGPSW